MAGEIIPKLESTNGRNYWRVRLRRPSEGIEINERFTDEAAATEYIEVTVKPMLSKGAVPIQGNPARMTFGQLAHLYLNEPMLDMTGERELKPSSVAERTLRIKVLAEVFGRIKLNRLTPAILKDRLGSQGWGRQNRQKYEVTLNRVFEWGRSQEPPLIASNPLSGIVRTSGKSKKLKRTYTIDEWTALLASADEENVPIGLFLRLLRATGARKSELHNMLWEDVQPIDDEGLGARLLFRDTKNLEDRAAFISDEMYLLLQAHEQQYRTPENPRIFNFKVDPMFRKVRAQAGLDQPDRRGEHLTIHAIRRTFATELGKKGATLAEMRAAGGWKTAEQAMRYMQIDEGLAASAAKRLLS